MTQTSNGLPASSLSLFASADRIRIAQLALGQPPESEASPYVEAVVYLVWPYSSKNKALSLLLVEPDVRLRSAQGQVRVTFRGSVAQRIATSQLGIGDSVLLQIAHAEWKDTGDAVDTPGKKVQWDLNFKNRVVLEARRNGSHFTTIDYEGSDTPPPLSKANSRHLDGFHNSDSIAFSTPVTGGSKRISSGSFIDASLDPFADDDGFVLGKGRKRTKFGRTSGAWTLLDERETSEHAEDLQPSPEVAVTQTSERNISALPTNLNGLEDIIILEDDSSSESSPVESSMPPPLAPFRNASERGPREASPPLELLISPRLHPIASSGLPMVSPLVKIGGASGYFDVQASALSELDAISVSSTSPQEVKVVNNFAAEESGDKSGLQTAASAKAADPSLFSSVPGSFPGYSGFNTQPESSFAAADFSANIGQSSFAKISSSSDIASQFPSFDDPSNFGGPSNFGSWGENRTGAGFGFATTAGDTSTKIFAGVHSPEVAQQAPDSVVQEQSAQEMEVSVNDQRGERPFIGVGLGTHSILSRERELSEDDDDMYGSARPRTRTPSLRSVVSEKSESVSGSSEEQLDVTMFDADVTKVPLEAFPPSQDWNSMTKKKRRQLHQSPFLDGASDEMSENGAFEDETVAEVPAVQASMPISSETLEPAQSIEARDMEVADIVPLTNAEDTATFESLTRAQIAVGPLLELQGRPNLLTRTGDLDETQITANDDSIDHLTTAELNLEFEELGAEQTTELIFMGDQQTDEAVAERDGDEASTKPEQLLTPDNTQQNSLDRHSFESVQQVPSLRMPLTPDNTQEAAYADVAQLDGHSDYEPLEQENDSAEISLPTPVQSHNVKSGLSRRSVQIPALSSPYFTARRSARLSLDTQMEVVGNRELEDAVDQEETMEQEVQDIPTPIYDQTVGLSPRHDIRLDDILGMATPLSYYTPLPNLDEYYGQQVDVLAICTADSGVPTRSKAGPKDYNVTLHLVDSFLDRAVTVTAQVFRPYKSALPSVRRGEVILLRSFKVRSQKRKMMLLSTNSSAWAVFSVSDVPLKDADYLNMQVDVKGPPVEYGPEEYVHSKRLMGWWETDGRPVDETRDPLSTPRSRDGPDNRHTTSDRTEQVIKGTTNELGTNTYKSPDVDPPRTERTSRRNKPAGMMENDRQTRSKSTPLSPTFEPASPTSARETRSSRRAANRTDHTGNEADPTPVDTIEPVLEPTKNSRRARRSTSVSEMPEPSSRTLRSQSTVHELRDGTKYVDGRVPTRKDGIHVLRDGTKYVDEIVSPPHVGKTRGGSGRGESVVHELRDGTTYVDEDGFVEEASELEARRSKRKARGPSLVHELRDGKGYTDD